jgi:hypothetical protein
MGSRADGSQLLQDFTAIAVILDHLCYASRLPFQPPHALQYIGLGG